MNKKQIIRTLAAHAADAVVLLEKIWPDDAFPAKLCDRVDASDYFITNRGAVIANDMRVPFLAEQVGAVGISSDVCARTLENYHSILAGPPSIVRRPHDRMGQETALSGS